MGLHALTEKEWERTFDAVPDLIMILDTQHRIVRVNRAMAVKLGVPPEDAVGLTCHERIHGTKRPPLFCPNTRLMADGRQHAVEVFDEGFGGDFIISVSPLHDGEKRLIGSIHIAHDITERKKREKEIAELSIFPEMNPAPVIKVDGRGTILRSNKAARKLYGQKDLSTRSWMDLCPECRRDDLLKTLEQKETFQHESRIKDQHFLFTYKMVPDSDRIYIFGADISDRKKAEVLLQNAHDQLEDRVTERTAELVAAKEELMEALDQVEQLKNRLQAENIYLQEEIKLNHNFEEIIGRSIEIKTVLSQVEQVAATDATVLILGETGTGKELFARAIHNLSPRKKRPLVRVNCAALQASLIESELFGHEKGAFTGAVTQRIGRFELAHGGAIFLDEIGDLTPELQSKLLRVIQEGEFERLGGSKTIGVDVRVIAATHRDIEKAVRAGKFREDLYYRLNVFPIVLPPLRQRKKDIPFLIHHFIDKYGHTLRKTIDTVPQNIMAALKAYPWPGNVRELENIIERAVIVTRGSSLQLDTSHLEAPANSAAKPTHILTLDELQRNHILDTLKETAWRIEGEQGAAKRLGLNASTLRSRMKKLGISKP
jgi:PAS domain S-box-containing protein